MIFASRTRRSKRRQVVRAAIESLESRTFLSVANPVMHPGDTFTAVPSVQGETPAQIRKAYGIDQLNLNGVPGDGSGQTIAIVDPYNDPSVVADLAVFDEQFNIADPPSFVIKNQTGGADLPRTNGSWAGEIATDVEWAHAIAPGASILLIETNSDNTSDLMAGVDFARHQDGVSVISLSWGGGEFSGQTTYDDEFKTPSGHQGITVLVAAGDNGAAGGAQWPATSPNVVAVGGTVLTFADSSGTYGSETSWTSTSGGYSRFEAEPSWQKIAQDSGARSMPDVAFNADDNAGLALYDSVPFEGITGWQTTNGTSVGTPCWAGLIAIADQGRVLNGLTTLDGPTQTLPSLYAGYGAPGTSNYSTYTAEFHDIINPQNPLAKTGLPTPGYDVTTGLGSPIATGLLNQLVNTPDAATLAGLSLPSAPQVTISFASAPPVSAVSGSAGFVHVKLSDGGANPYAGPVIVSLYASTDQVPATNPSPVITVTLPNLLLHYRKFRTFKIAFTYPTESSPTSDFLIAQVNSLAPNSTPAEAVTLNTMTIAPPFVQLQPTFAGRASVHVKPGKKASVTVLVRNIGNIPATGTLGITLDDSTDQTLDSSDSLLAASPAHTINLKPGKSATIHLSFPVPLDQTPGTYFLIASVNSSLSGQTGNVAIATS